MKKALPDNKYCKYHSDAEHRKEAGISDEDVFLDLIEDEEDVLAPKFKNIEINNEHIDKEYMADISILHPIVENNLNIKNSSILDNIRILNGCMFDVRISNVETESEIKFRDSVIKGDLRIKCDDMTDRVLLKDTDIHGHTHISGEFAETVDLSGSRFGGILLIDEVECDNNLLLSDCQFWTSLLVENSHINGMMDLHPIDTDYLVYISESDINNINLSSLGPSDCLVRIYDSNVSNGYLRQQDRGDTFYDFTNSRIGDLELEFGSGDLNLYYFNYTDYTNFDFTKIHNRLNESGWKIHNFDINNERANLKISNSIDSPGTIPHRKYEDAFEMRNYVETYIKAKERASRQGDNRSASEFLINEMRAKRKKRRHKLSTSSLRFREQVYLRSAQAKNVFLDVTCGFGEKPWKAALSAAAIPILFGSFLFPLFGGVKNIETGQRLAFSLDGTFDIHLLLETVVTNIYFSILAFSTLGSETLVPASTYSRMLTAFVSILGPFFVALFVFTLGKQVTR